VSKAKSDNRADSKSDKISPDLDTPTDMPQAAVGKISAALNRLVADAFALYLKTKNFHWHVSGRHFHDYHLMLD
jgi:starvation-inducible DNA-binding protein